MLYKTFSSLKTSVWILSIMCLFYVLGTIFPQGQKFDAYVEAGGKFVFLVKALSLLDIFTSPLFLFLTGLLTINLLVCIYDRFRTMKKRKRVPVVPFFRSSGLIDIGRQEDTEAVIDRLKSMRFKFVGSQDGVYVFTKGLPYWWLSWIYHLGMVVAIAGFILTALTAFEGEVTLYKDTPQKISLFSPDTRLNRYLKKLGVEVPEEKKEKEYELLLKDFETEYYQTLKFDYPKDKLSRLAIGLGWRSSEFLKSQKSGFSPKMWKTTFELTLPQGEKLDAALWVNRPFRHGGLTLYQMGFEQKIKLRVSGKTIDVESMEPFEIDGVKGKFVTSIVKTGKVYKKDGTVEDITPFFELSYIPEEGGKEKLGEVHLGKPVKLKGRRFLFKEFEEGSVLSYRVDAGVPIIGVSILLVFVGLFIRSFGYWYRVQIGSKDGRLLMRISTRGLSANKDRIITALKQ
jgi:hypothetical protein